MERNRSEGARIPVEELGLRPQTCGVLRSHGGIRYVDELESFLKTRRLVFIPEIKKRREFEILEALARWQASRLVVDPAPHVDPCNGRSRLLPLKRASHKTLEDCIYVMAVNVEDALMTGGGRPGQDYKLLDLYSLAIPLAASMMGSDSSITCRDPGSFTE